MASQKNLVSILSGISEFENAIAGKIMNSENFADDIRKHVSKAEIKKLEEKGEVVAAAYTLVFAGDAGQAEYVKIKLKNLEYDIGLLFRFTAREQFADLVPESLKNETVVKTLRSVGAKRLADLCVSDTAATPAVAAPRKNKSPKL